MLSNKKIPSLAILKFLLLNGIRVEYNMSKEQLCTMLLTLISKKSPDNSQITNNVQQNNINKNNFVIFTQNNHVTINQSTIEVHVDSMVCLHDYLKYIF